MSVNYPITEMQRPMEMPSVRIEHVQNEQYPEHPFAILTGEHRVLARLTLDELRTIRLDCEAVDSQYQTDQLNHAAAMNVYTGI